jgi:hypothetical protein
MINKEVYKSFHQYGGHGHLYNLSVHKREIIRTKMTYSQDQ